MQARFNVFQQAVNNFHMSPGPSRSNTTLRRFASVQLLLPTVADYYPVIAKNAKKRPAYVEWSVYQSGVVRLGSSPVRPLYASARTILAVRLMSSSLVRGRPGFYADRYCCCREFDRIRRAGDCGRITIAGPYGTRIDPARIQSGFAEVLGAAQGQAMMDRRPPPERKGHARYSVVMPPEFRY